MSDEVGASGAKSAAVDPTVLAEISATLDLGLVVEDHTVRWTASAWLEDTRWDAACRAKLDALAETLPEIKPRIRGIARRDVFQSRDGDPLDFFLATMAWGYGDQGVGSFRTHRVLESGGRVGITFLVRRLRDLRGTNDYRAFFDTWMRRPTAIKHLKTAFASKLAYFAAYDAETGRGPLIADDNTHAAVRRLAGISDSLTSSEGYDAYVRWADAVASELGCRSDKVELALFGIGRSTK